MVYRITLRRLRALNAVPYHINEVPGFNMVYRITLRGLRALKWCTTSH